MRDGVKVILINKEKKFLLNLRDRDHHENPHYWSLIGGGIDEGETPNEAIVRETKEEISYDLKDFEKIYEEDIPNVGKRIFYLAKIDVPISELVLGEGEDLKYFTYEEIKDLKVNPLHRKVLKLALTHI